MSDPSKMAAPLWRVLSSVCGPPLSAGAARSWGGASPQSSTAVCVTASSAHRQLLQFQPLERLKWQWYNPRTETELRPASGRTDFCKTERGCVCFLQIHDGVTCKSDKLRPLIVRAVRVCLCVCARRGSLGEHPPLPSRGPTKPETKTIYNLYHFMTSILKFKRCNENNNKNQ